MKRGIVGWIILAIIAVVLAYFLWPEISSAVNQANCNNLESDFQTLLNKSVYCSDDSDCTAINTSCQLGCYAVVNKNSDINSLVDISSRYSQSGCKVCNKLCTIPPQQTEVGCLNGVCIDERQEVCLPGSS